MGVPRNERDIGEVVLTVTRAFRGFFLGATALATSGEAYAQTQADQPVAAQSTATAPAADEASGDIVVTARQRSETLQDAPAAIAAFNARAIEDSGITSVRDALAQIPNVTSIESQSSAFSFVLIRGITQVRNTDASVAYVVDGVLNTSPFSFSQELYDIEQIEVLKGPQGALYGRNSVGGAINIRTKDPTNDFEGQVRGFVGNGEAYGIQGVLSGPIATDKLLFRIAASYRDAEGYRRNITLDRPQDPEEDYGVRGKLLWNASDALRVDLRAAFQKTSGASQQFANIAPRFQAANNFVAPPLQIVGGDPTPVLAGPLSGLAGLVGNPNTSRPPLQSNVFGIDEREITTVSLKGDLDLGFATLTAISAYDLTDSLLGGDQYPYTAALIQKNSQRRRSEAFSQEIRLTSPGDRPFRWILGAYYADVEFFFAANIQLDVTGGDPAFIKREPVLGGAEPSIFYNADDNKNRSYAGFGQVAYDVLEGLEVSAALRYDYEERTQTVVTPNDFIPAFVPLRQGDSRDLTFDRWQPKATIKYEATRDLTFYANFATGFRSGGFNPSGVGARAEFLRATQPALAIQANIRDTFGQETTKGVDGGVKTRLFGGALNLEAAAYYTEVSDQFTFNFIAALSNAQIVRNIEESVVKGFELDAVLSLGRDFKLFAGYGYTDTEITRFAAEPQNEGNRLPYIPASTINLGAQGRHVVGTLGGYDVALFGRVDWQRLGSTHFEPANFIARDPVNLVNARVGVELDRAWSLNAYAKNLGDENYFAEFGSPPGFAYYARPRQYGLELTGRF